MGNLAPCHHKTGRIEPLTGENCQWFFITWPYKSALNPCPSLHLIIHFLRPRLKPLPLWPNPYPFSLNPRPEMFFLSNLPTDFFPFRLKLAVSRVDIQGYLLCRLPTNLHNHLTLILSNQNWGSSRPAHTALKYSNDADRTDAEEKESACGSLERKKVSSYLDNEKPCLSSTVRKWYYTWVGRSSEGRHSKSDFTKYKGRGTPESKVARDRMKMDLGKYYTQCRSR